MAESAGGGTNNGDDHDSFAGAGEGGSGGNRTRSEPAQRRSAKATGKRRRAAVDFDDDNTRPTADDAVSTPAAKQPRGLYGRVSGLVGRAVGLLTPGRARRPTAAAAAAALPLDSAAAGSDSEENDGMGDGHDHGGTVNSWDEDSAHRVTNGARTGAGARHAAPKRQTRSQTMMAARNEDGGMGGSVTSDDRYQEKDPSAAAGGGASAVEDARHAALRRGVTRSSRATSRRNAASRQGGDAAVGFSPSSSSGLATAEEAAPLALGNTAVFSPGVRNDGLKTRARTRGATAAAAAAASRASRRESDHGLGFASLRESTTGNGERSNPASSPEYAGEVGACPLVGGTRRALGGNELTGVDRGVSWANGSGHGVGDSSAGTVDRASNADHNNGSRGVHSLSGFGGQGIAAASTSQPEDGNEEEDPPFTRMELRDLVRSLRFRRGLPPAAAMYLLSKMESTSAALVRRQILQEHREVVVAARDAAAGGAAGDRPAAKGAGGGSGLVGGRQAPLGGRSAGRASRGPALIAPVALRGAAPPGADSAPLAPLRSPLMPPPPPRGLSSDVLGVTIGSQGLYSGGLSGMRGEMRPPPSRGDYANDLLTPARRARVDGQHGGRERSFAHATPGGARVWKPASSDQGTPWAARSHQRTRPGGRTVVVEEIPRRDDVVGVTPSRRRSVGTNGPRTPAAMARRIISVLEDAGTPRSPVRLTRPEQGPAGDALALRPRRHAEDGPLPTRMLSVPHPSGGAGSGGGVEGAAAPVTPARLPLSRWARRSETQREASQQVGSAAVSSSLKTGGEFLSTSPPGSRKRKTVGQDAIGNSGDSEAIADPVEMETDGAGEGRLESNDAPLGGGAQVGADAGDAPLDESATAPPRTKRARTSSEGLVQPSGGRGNADDKNDALRTPAVVGSNKDDGNERSGDPQSLPADVRPRTDVASAEHRSADVGNGDAKGRHGNGDNTDDAGGSAGLKPASTARAAPATPGREQENVAEEAKRLEARRRGRQARSPYVYGGGRVDPNAGLPKSIRPPAVTDGFGGEGGGESVFAGPPKTPTKYWTCRACYVRNYSMDAKACDMCRMARNYGTPQHRNPPAILPGGRTLYTVRAGLEAVGLAAPAQADAAADKRANDEAAAAVVAKKAFDDAVPAAMVAPAGPTSKSTVRFQFGGSAITEGTESIPAPAPSAAPVVAPNTAPSSSVDTGGTAAAPSAAAPVAATPRHVFAFGSGVGAADNMASSGSATGSATPASGAPVAATTTTSTAAVAPVAERSAAGAATVTSAFTFGASATKPVTASTATAAADQVASAAAAPPVSSTTPAAAPTSTPAFTFGAAAAPLGNKVAAPAAESSTAAHAGAKSGKPGFTFGASSGTPADAGPTAKFTFGAAATTAGAGVGSAPLQTLGITSAPFAFGGKAAAGAGTAGVGAGGAGAALAGAAQAVGAPAKTTLFGGAPTSAPAAPAFSFGAATPSPTPAAPAATAGAAGGIASRLGPAPAAAGATLAAPTPSAFPAFGGGGFGADGSGANKRAPSPAIGFGLGTQGPPKRGPSPAASAFGVGGGFGGTGIQAPAQAPTPAPTPAPGAAFSFGQPQQPPTGGVAAGLFGATGAAPQPSAQAPSAAFSFGATTPAVAPVPAVGAFGAQPRPGQFGVTAPGVANPGGFGMAGGGFAAGVPGAAAPTAGGFSLGAGAQHNTKGRRIVKGVRRPKQKR